MVVNIVVKVKDLMNPNLISVDSSASIMEAIRTMTDHEIGAIDVTQDGVPVGIITERDCLKKVCGKLDCRTVSVDEIMSTPLITVESDASLYTAVIQMLSHNIRRLLVTQNGTIIGIFTQKDLLTKINSVFLALAAL